MVSMDLLAIAIGLLFLLERVGKYLIIEHFFDRESAQPDPPQLGSSASIIQPILSGDPTLWDCLERNLQMKSRHSIEFIWAIDDDDPDALVGCQDLVSRYPQVKIELLSLPPSPPLVSPKTFKLIAGIERAHGEIIAFLDDDTILNDGDLDRAIPYLERPEIGAAFGLPYYINFSNVWSTLVACVVNSSSLLTYIPYTFITEPFTINGMFYVMKREVLEQIGGFTGLESAIADDFAIAHHIRSHGYKLAQTPVCHGISTQIRDAKHYFNLLNRWFIFPQVSILKSVTVWELVVFYCTALIPTMVPLIIVVYLAIFPSIYTTVYGAVYFAINAYILTQFNRKYLNGATPEHLIFLLTIVQIIMPFHIIVALLSPKKIDWRGNILNLKSDGSFEFIERRTTQTE
jgi:ceramide glucosyltransferase